jgi:hypothetical protein
MPNYNWKNKKTGKTWTEFMTMAEADELEASNPNVVRMPNTPAALIPPEKLDASRKKPPADFRERLTAIKRSHYKSSINNI